MSSWAIWRPRFLSLVPKHATGKQTLFEARMACEMIYQGVKRVWTSWERARITGQDMVVMHWEKCHVQGWERRRCYSWRQRLA